jgi:hypothetical protein
MTYRCPDRGGRERLAVFPESVKRSLSGQAEA